MIPVPARPAPAQRRLSYSSLTDYARCGYRFYLTRELGLPRVTPPGEIVPAAAPEPEPEPAPEPVAGEPPPLDKLVRGSLVHALLEDLDFARPEPPDDATVLALGERAGLELAPAHVADVQAQVAAFAASPLCARLAAATDVRREAGFVFALEPGGGGPLLSGYLDVLAREPDGGVLIVDYKTDQLGEEEPGGADRPLLRHPAPRLRARRAPGRRAARRGRLRAARAARGARPRRVRAAGRARARRRAAGPRRRASSPSAGRSPRSRTATCAASARAGRRCARGRSG